ncbi:MAG: helix-turn-helix domain-containing protein [Bacilli bacterium]|nr:helix-turn-helix domain-containing protein [Bacilli bacterium]
MKEIGLLLKEKREENGVSLEEAASDLQMRVSQLESIEEGRKDDFKDVFSLKYFIRDYAKYLGLDGEELLDSFNEYLFEETSKISLEEIEEARKKKEESERDMKILSPYTVTKKDKKNRKILFIAVTILILLLVSIYLIIRNKGSNDDFSNSKISYIGGENNELSK